MSTGDKAPLSYPWLDKLKDADDYDSYLPHSLGMYKRNSEGELIYDTNGKIIPILDAYNCNYAAYGANPDPTSYALPFTKILAYPALSNIRRLTGSQPVKVEDRVNYFIWLDPNQSLQYAILHSAIVVQVDADGYATQVKSKMGESYGIIYHHPRDIPEAYGPTGPISVFPNGVVMYNRIYYRQRN